uniref:Uncharacterized protein n=1 Tax=Anguilla anguilla TaxID=7936 RepID=A0A0E9RS49_ANGAN
MIPSQRTKCGGLPNFTAPPVIVSSGGLAVWMWGLPATPAVPSSHRCESCPRDGDRAEWGFKDKIPTAVWLRTATTDRTPHVPGTECVPPPHVA